MTTAIALILVTLFLAYSNGANDNFKGVATLRGSKTASHSVALWWATVTTLAGSLVSILVAQGLVENFKGKGLVPMDLAGSPDFMLAVALAAGLTVMAAALMGLPISTTHSLMGGLIGAGLVGAGAGEMQFAVLWKKFFLPLLASPVMAIALAAIFYFIARGLCDRLKLCDESKGQCSLSLSTSRLSRSLNGAHFLSAGAVSFARGLNDTPKMMALIVTLEILNVHLGLGLLAVAIAVGGLLNSRKIAITMSERITEMNDGQGFTANVVTSLLVIGASRMGLPVSTTHVSCSALFGIGAVTKQAHWGMISQILLSWVLTLPVAGVFAAVAFAILN